MPYGEWIGRIALARVFFSPYGRELTGYEVSDIAKIHATVRK
jgi:hypothetical protein